MYLNALLHVPYKVCTCISLEFSFQETGFAVEIETSFEVSHIKAMSIIHTLSCVVGHFPYCISHSHTPFHIPVQVFKSRVLADPRGEVLDKTNIKFAFDSVSLMQYIVVSFLVCM